MSTTEEKEVAIHFSEHVRRHRVTVIQDDGVFRNIKFSNPNTIQHSFSLITWPGRLVIDGDMGTYVFSRLEDMFQFFRSPDGSINASYWAEKLRAEDRHGSTRKFSPMKARAAFAYLIEDWPPEAKRQAFEELYDLAPEDNYDSYASAVDDVCVIYEGHDYRVEDWLLESDVYEWSYRFLWNLHAIVWGIQQYDARRTPPPTEGRPLGVPMAGGGS